MSKEKTQTQTWIQAMVFTVADSENAAKPVVWAQSASSRDRDVQENAMDLISDWCKGANVPVTEPELEDLAYLMRKAGCARHLGRYCFELTEMNG